MVEFYRVRGSGGPLVNMVYLCPHFPTWRKIAGYKVAMQIGEIFQHPIDAKKNDDTYAANVVKILSKQLFNEPSVTNYRYTMDKAKIESMEVTEKNPSRAVKIVEQNTLLAMVAFLRIVLGEKGCNPDKFIAWLVAQWYKDAPKEVIEYDGANLFTWIMMVRMTFGTLLDSYKEMNKLLDQGRVMSFHCPVNVVKV